MDNIWDCIIVGGGAAGLSAALVLGRARRRVLLVDAGSQSNLSAHGIGGLLGSDGRPPADLYAAGRTELAAYPTVEVRSGEVVSGDPGFELEVTDGVRERARTVLLATGMAYRPPNIAGLEELWGGTVFHCPFCDGWELRDAPLAVVARGDRAVHSALLLTGWTDDVVVLTDGEAGLDDAQIKLLDAADIGVDDRSIARFVAQDGELAAVEFTDGARLARRGALVATTSHQRSPLAAHLGAVSAPTPFATDALVVDELGRTSVPGLFAAGDLAGQMPQVASAVASGSQTGAAVVQSLLAEDVGLRVPPWPTHTAVTAQYWERHYGQRGRVWSGRVNAQLERIATDLPAGRALDLGCGEGGDAVWLAEHGWQVTATDVSETALRRAAGEAEARGVSDRITFERHDFATSLPDGRFAPLATVASWESRRGFEALRHAQGRLAVEVSAAVASDVTNANAVQALLEADTLPQLAQKYGFEFSFEGRSADQRETMADMRAGLILGLALIYLILVWSFSSWSWPLVVMSAIPLGLAGAIFGHWVLDIDLTILSMFGLFGLAGIVVNNSIILVSLFKELQNKGASVHDALVGAACGRLRAVLLTSLTTIGGLTPLLFERSLQAQFLIPMATSIAFGLGFSAVLVLFFVPALLSLLESLRHWRTGADARPASA